MTAKDWNGHVPAETTTDAECIVHVLASELENIRAQYIHGIKRIDAALAVLAAPEVTVTDLLIKTAEIHGMVQVLAGKAGAE